MEGPESTAGFSGAALSLRLGWIGERVVQQPSREQKRARLGTAHKGGCDMPNQENKIGFRAETGVTIVDFAGQTYFPSNQLWKSLGWNGTAGTLIGGDSRAT